MPTCHAIGENESLQQAGFRAKFSKTRGLYLSPQNAVLLRDKSTGKGVDEAIAVFRVECNKGYTVMRNHHLRNKELTLKEKDLLLLMLSLPEDLYYTIIVLFRINKKSIDTIHTAI